MPLEYFGGPAPLFENPYQLQAGGLSFATGVLMVLAVIGVAVNKVAEETCSENFVGLFSAIAALSFAAASLFLYVAMMRLGSDAEWIKLNILMIMLTYSIAFCGAAGAIMLVNSSTLVSVLQCFSCCDPTTQAVKTECVESDDCCTGSLQYISSYDECPGVTSNSRIDCEIAFLCQEQAPKTFAMGAVVTSFTLLFAIAMAFSVFVKFLPHYLLQQRKIAKFK